jgi:hypothetical protein
LITIKQCFDLDTVDTCRYLFIVGDVLCLRDISQETLPHPPHQSQPSRSLQTSPNVLWEGTHSQLVTVDIKCYAQVLKSHIKGNTKPEDIPGKGSDCMKAFTEHVQRTKLRAKKSV